jgi:hypothetical protein
MLAAASVAAAAAAGAALTGGTPGWLDAFDEQGAVLDQQALVATQLPTAASSEPVWERAQRLRSEALDRGQRFGAVETAEPVWQQALQLRSEALDRGQRFGAVETAEPVWQHALRLRSEALDRRYGLDR